jgi:hypothetical protein
MSTPRLSPVMTNPEALVDTLLEESSELTERSAALKAQTWHRLRRSAIGIANSSRPTFAITGWLPTSLAAIAAMATVTLLVHVSRGPPKATTTPTPIGIATATNPATSRDQRSDGWREIDVTAGLLFAAPGTTLQLPDAAPTAHADYVVNLDRGELCVQVAHRDPLTQGSFVVRTTELRAVAIGTRFCVTAGASADESWVAVEEGRVRVDRMGLPSVLAGPGDLVRGTDQVAPADRAATHPPIRPSFATGAPQRRATSSCLASASPEGEQRCLWLQAGRDDLAAQNALYLLGALARDQEHDGRTALSIWQTDLHRFPRGALKNETIWAVFDELVAERRYEEALSATEDFVRDSRSSPQASQLALKRGDVLVDELHRPLQAQQIFRNILASETRPLLRDEALFKLGICLEQLGETSEALATWQRYETEFPRGRHSLEVGQRLDSRSGSDPIR